MKYSSYSNKTIEIIEKTLYQAIKLTAKSSCFERIRSILVNTDIEKPPDFLGGLIGGFSIYLYQHNLLHIKVGGSESRHD